jgi:hypothetical protein
VCPQETHSEVHHRQTGRAVRGGSEQLRVEDYKQASMLAGAPYRHRFQGPRLLGLMWRWGLAFIRALSSLDRR